MFLNYRALLPPYFLDCFHFYILCLKIFIFLIFYFVFILAISISISNMIVILLSCDTPNCANIIGLDYLSVSCGHVLILTSRVYYVDLVYITNYEEFQLQLD